MPLVVFPLAVFGSSCVCWLVGLAALGGLCYGLYMLATKGGELALRRDREQHLKIVNEARRKNGQPPLTVDQLSTLPDDDQPMRIPRPGGFEVIPGAPERPAPKPVQPDPDFADPYSADVPNPALANSKAVRKRMAEVEAEDKIPMAEMAVPPIPPMAVAATSPKVLHSIVLLDADYRPIEEGRLRKTLERAWEVEFPVNDPHATEFVVHAGEGQPAVVSCGGFRFLINAVNAPYFENPAEVLAEITEARTRQAVVQSKAWRSIDLLAGEEAESAASEGVYAMLGKVAAALAGPGTFGFLITSTNRFFPYTDETLKALLSDDPLTSLEKASIAWVPTVTDDDGDLEKAMAEARRRFGEFAGAFVVRQDTGLPFLVRAAFTDGERTEHIWIEVTALEGGRIVGKLRSDPVHLQGYTEGQPITIKIDDVSDWIGIQDGKPIGNFTGPIMQRSRKP